MSLYIHCVGQYLRNRTISEHEQDVVSFWDLMDELKQKHGMSDYEAEMKIINMVSRRGLIEVKFKYYVKGPGGGPISRRGRRMGDDWGPRGQGDYQGGHGGGD
jgi:hypothetical protein